MSRDLVAEPGRAALRVSAMVCKGLEVAGADGVGLARSAAGMDGLGRR